MARAATGAGFYCQTFLLSHLKLWDQHHHKLEFTTPVLNGDAVDVLVVLNQYAFDNHIEDFMKMSMHI